MSVERYFVDTNVFVYVFDNGSPEKQTTARRWLSREDATLILSPQVLSEFFVTATRKLARPMSTDEARSAVASLQKLHVQPLTSALVSRAIDRLERSQLSYWDALIVETSIAAGADILLSEDMQHDQVLDSVRIRNPFVG